jgi:hypothetical protein
MSLDSVRGNVVTFDSSFIQTDNKTQPLSAAVSNRTSTYTLPLKAPDRSLSSQADLASATARVETLEVATLVTKTTSSTLEPARQAEITEKLEQVVKSATTDAGAAKVNSYKALAKSLFTLSTALTSTILLAISTVATQGGASPLLAISSLMLVSAIIDTVFAAINVARAHKDLPPINVESYLQTGVVSILRKMNVPEKVIDKLDTDVFKKMIIAYKLALIVSQVTLGLILAVPHPAMLELLMKITSGVSTAGKVAFELLWPTSAQGKAEEALSPEEEKKITAALESQIAQTAITTMVTDTLQTETKLPLNVQYA